VEVDGNPACIESSAAEVKLSRSTASFKRHLKAHSVSHVGLTN